MCLMREEKEEQGSVADEKLRVRARGREWQGERKPLELEGMGCTCC